MKVKFGLGTGSSVKPFDLHYEQWFSQGVKGVNASAAVIDLGSERQGAPSGTEDSGTETAQSGKHWYQGMKRCKLWRGSTSPLN